jgi:hypothetical protein
MYIDIQSSMLYMVLIEFMDNLFHNLVRQEAVQLVNNFIIIMGMTKIERFSKGMDSTRIQAWGTYLQLILDDDIMLINNQVLFSVRAIDKFYNRYNAKE